MSPRLQTLDMDVRYAVMRAAFVATGFFVLLALLLAPATVLFLGGLALAMGLGQGFAGLRRDAAAPLTGSGLALEHE